MPKHHLNKQVQAEAGPGLLLPPLPPCPSWPQGGGQATAAPAAPQDWRLLPVSISSLFTKRKAHAFLGKGKAAPNSYHRQTGDRLCHLLVPVQTCCMALMWKNRVRLARACGTANGNRCSCLHRHS